jgi:HK97 gp10 family phage protein
MAAELEGLAELERRLSLFEQYLGEELRIAVEWGVDMIVNEARQSTAFTDRTANLRNSIQAYVEQVATEVLVAEGIAHAGAGMEYAKYVEFGTGPRGAAAEQPIQGLTFAPGGKRTPKEAEALHWVGPGGDVFAASINWQGTHPHPFMFPAFEKCRPRIEEGIKGAVQRAARRLGA